MKVDVSVIIPIYNCEKYLEECLDSVLAQTFTNIEVICINDCSTDHSQEILEKYAKKDCRVKILQNESNLGAGETRNRGLQNASGKYILFLDGDDFFELDMLEICYTEALQNQVDVVEFYYDRFNNQNRTFTHGVFQENINPVLVSSYPILNNESGYSYLFQTAINAPWTKLVKREFLINNQIEFPNLKNVEDVLYSYQVFMNASKIMFIDKILLHYRQNLDSSVTVDSFKDKVYIVEVYEAVYKALLSCEKRDVLERSFINAMIRSLYQYYTDQRTSERGWNEIKSSFWRFYTETLHTCKWSEEVFYNAELFEFYFYLIEERDEKGKWNLFHGCRKYEQLVNYCKRNHYVTALWGAGEWGEAFLDAYHMHEGEVEYIIDVSEQKIGTEFCGKMVYDYESISEKIDVIIVTNPFYIKEIMKKVNNPQKKILNLYPFIEYGCDIEMVIQPWKECEGA